MWDFDGAEPSQMLYIYIYIFFLYISKNKFPFGLRHFPQTFYGTFVLPGQSRPTIQAMAQSWRPYRPIFPSRTAFQRPFRPIFPSKTTFWRPYRPIFPSRASSWQPYRPIFPSKKPLWRPYRPIFLSKDHILIEFVFEILDLICMADLQTSSSTKLRNNFVAGPL